MNGSLDWNNLLDILAKILIRCFILGVIFLLAGFLIYVTNRDFVYGLHSQWFHMTREQVDWMMYTSLGIAKLFLLGVYLCPYMAIRLILPRK